MAVGRPPKYKNADELQTAIDDYFQKIIDENDIITITGLVLHLGFCDRQSFYAYEKKPEFSYTIKRARSFIENHYEKLLIKGNVTGAIFALKNFGWKDKQEIDTSINTSNNTLKIEFTDASED